ncbi:MAG TPA: UDP-3-O-(3-hydroxymyristoyl)glucosamine N-acyltransferase [Rhizomicrobium sp.]|jgi:UDP-3-O-[3-hydroxymyristoyl] glucosamine N-acyltransferase|nr:UDP-3-O-(3-hydroxymyristoyl)glucosamine N-acyltransferase [Rhizomicrobium sp.]
MADPRFFDNRGPFSLAEICTLTGADLGSADGAAMIADVATLDGAGPLHLAFCAGKSAAKSFAQSGAGFCFIPKDFADPPPAGLVTLRCGSVPHAFAAAARHFYPQSDMAAWTQAVAIDPSAKLGEGVTLAPGVVIGPGAEIGEGTRVGPNTVIARGVAIGRACDISSGVTISHALIGDNCVVFPGALIGQPGFGFASSGRGHVNIPQLGRVILQDKVEIGAGCTIDRGALGDTVIGEGSKLDNQVHLGHNCHIGRHCLIAAQAGFAGSSTVGDFFACGGQIGVADHAHIGAHVRLAGRTGVMPGDLPGGQDYGGVPARPIGQWRREMAAVALLAKRRKRDKDG